MNACGCHACGGPAARADALAAWRLVTYRAFLERLRGPGLANRTERPTLYSALAIRAAGPLTDDDHAGGIVYR